MQWIRGLWRGMLSEQELQLNRVISRRSPPIPKTQLDAGSSGDDEAHHLQSVDVGSAGCQGPVGFGWLQPSHRIWTHLADMNLHWENLVSNGYCGQYGNRDNPPELSAAGLRWGFSARFFRLGKLQNGRSSLEPHSYT